MTTTVTTNATDRQTHKDLLHPNGEVWHCVYDNGPRELRDPTGKVVTSNFSSGARTGFGSYVRATINGEVVEFKATNTSDHHLRKWCPMQGYGWLVMERHVKGEPWWFRFEGDDGSVTRFSALKMYVGRHGIKMPDMKPTKPDKLAVWEENEHWTTYEGKTIVRMFRDKSYDDLPEVVYTKPEKVKKTKADQLKLPGIGT